VDKIKAVLLTTHGTIDVKRLTSGEVQAIKELRAKGIALVVITGWNFDQKGPTKEIRDKLNPDALITESSILYTRPNLRWDVGKPVRVPLFGNDDIRYVKRANAILLDQIISYAKAIGTKAVFYSQGNEAGVCYYVTPPDDILENLRSMQATKEPTTEQTRNFLAEHGINGISLSSDSLTLRDTEESRYWLEKLNAKHRTFLPYSLETIEEENLIKLYFKPRIPETKLRSDDLQRIVDLSWNAGKLSPEEHRRIKPQKDVCIDIFCRPKEDTWLEALKKAGFYEERRSILFVSKGTQSDIPLIIKGLGMRNFRAFGSEEDISQALKDTGVKVAGRHIADTFRMIAKMKAKNT
jgi:hypothetical protein